MAFAKLGDVERAFREYLKQTTSDKSNLKDFIENATSLLERLKLTDQELNQHGAHHAASRVLAMAAIAFPLHLSRHRVPLAEGSSAFLAGIGEGDWAVVKQAVDLLTQKGQPPVAWHVDYPLDLAGYDPRFKSLEEAESYYDVLLRSASPKGIPHGRAKGFKAYHQAKYSIYRDFHDRATRFDLLVVDFAWLPELAYRGYVYRLEDLDPDPFREVRKSIEDERFAEILSYLCRAGAEEQGHYAVPLFLSLQVSGMRTNKGLQPELIQTQGSSSCVYELYAHFAEAGAQPIKVIQQPATTGAARYIDPDCTFASEESQFALSTFLARLHTSLRGKDSDWDLDHETLVRRVEDGNPGSHSLNTELVSRLKAKLGPQFVVAGPKPSLNDSDARDLKKSISGRQTFLTADVRLRTSLGGYALAVSRQSGDPNKAWRVAQQILTDALKEPEERLKVIPESVRSATTQGWVLGAADFCEFHTRPQVPFWTQLEERIFATIQVLYKRFLAHVKNDSSYEKNEHSSLWLAQRAAEFLKIEKDQLIALDGAVRMTFSNNGWVYEAKD